MTIHSDYDWITHEQYQLIDHDPLQYHRCCFSTHKSHLLLFSNFIILCIKGKRSSYLFIDEGKISRYLVTTICKRTYSSLESNTLLPIQRLIRQAIFVPDIHDQVFVFQDHQSSCMSLGSSTIIGNTKKLQTGVCKVTYLGTYLNLWPQCTSSLLTSSDKFSPILQNSSRFIKSWRLDPHCMSLNCMTKVVGICALLPSFFLQGFVIIKEG